ncbi:putative cyclin-like protein [Golovinomyces cichoracearum]|uniref:Putative cyclin-like protein n=1 Tax=Golovinomyces cichoracearum TaxID=62708 RepID=A0A420HAC3_9PEZI|nr:putative cyclin-like protein [Golovinomyces cichoracearum]
MFQTTFWPALELSFPPVSIHCTTRERKDHRSRTRRQTSDFPLERDGLQTPPPDDMSSAHPHMLYDAHDPSPSLVYVTSSVPSNIQPSYAQKRPSTTVNLPPLIAGNDLRDDRPRFQSWQSWEQHQNQSKRHLPEQQPKKRNTNGSESKRIKLQIPSTISAEGGSLSDFAAQITCLFWFESMDTLLEAEGISPTSTTRSLRPEAIPCSAFKKWVSTILSTTQVTDKVAILALLFIYRLKKYNSSVKGRSGSEYRLFTVALMLGNKFLDDNTYTNNTWAEVSGISVQEIHVMEVEFLSNMRYSLVASKEQWEEWHQKLKKFKQYCDAATRASVAFQNQPPMPSPPETTRISPLNSKHSYAPKDSYTARESCMSSSLSSASISTLPPPCYPRKRSLDKETDEPAMKRLAMGPNATMNHHLYGMSQVTRSHLSRIPSLPQKKAGTVPLNLPNSGSAHLILPPLGPSPQNCSTTPSKICTSSPTTPSGVSPFNFSAVCGSGGNGCGTQSNSSRITTSPQNHSNVHDLLSYNSSPLSTHYTGHSGHISPSVILQQRTSPYKPVRHVNTLLYPPPFSSVHENSVNVEEMRYRPLGKSNENLRTGVVPHWPPHWQPHLHE